MKLIESIVLLSLAAFLPGCGAYEESSLGCSGADADGYCPEAPQCDEPTDCIAAPSCWERTCERHQCGGRPRPDGEVIYDFVRGDCQQVVCHSGEPLNEPDAVDVPDAGECMIGTCKFGGLPTMRPDGLSCSVGVCKDGQCMLQ